MPLHEKLERGNGPTEAFFQKALEFSRRFTDRYHHYKEEYLLFGLLAQKKEGAIDLQTGVLRLQHERCRALLNTIEQSADEYGKGNEIATTTLLQTLAAYISILKRHIHIENHIFFKMAEEELSPEEDRLLLDQFLNEDSKPENDRIFKKSKGMLDEIGSLLNNQGSWNLKKIPDKGP